MPPLPKSLGYSPAIARAIKHLLKPQPQTLWRKSQGDVVRFTISACLASLLAGSTAYAANSKIQTGPAPKWAVQSEPMPVPADAAGAVFIRRQDTEVHLDDKGQLLYNGYRIKILHPNALQLGNLSLAWNPAAGSPVVHAMKIHREGQVIDLLKTASFEILRREDQLEAARLDGNLTAVLRVPDLRVGDEIDRKSVV